MPLTCAAGEEAIDRKMKWFWIILAIIYVLSPFDLIPGMHSIGWIDDIIVIMLLFRYLSKIKSNIGDELPPFSRDQHKNHNTGTDSSASKKSGRMKQSPHAILNISATASQQEIKAAYRKLASQYHPDKVAHLGKEFQELAEKRFKEIQEAYQALIQ
jgi:uncharacterized membrane protein YkvA (DUF1232 family)